jgi:PAS domain S-box-containing protein
VRAVAVVAVAVGARLLLAPVLGASLPFITLFPASFVIAYLWGLGPTVFGTLVGLLSAVYLFLEPQYTFILDTPTAFIGVVLFAVSGIATGWLGEARLQAMRLAEEQALENERVRQVAEEAAAEAEMAAQQGADALAQQLEAEGVMRQAHEAVARLAAIVASSADAIVGKTLDGTVTSWNASAERIFGYPASEMIGQSIYKLIPPELHGAEADVLDRLRQGLAVEALETERVRSTGERVWISLSVSPIRDPAGRIIGAASIKRDVTEQRRAREALRDAQRLQAVGQLAGGIAHEANNQMLVVLGAAQFLLRRQDLTPAARQDVEFIREAAERTAAITQQLLAFSRRQTLQLQDVDLDGVIRAIAPVLRRSLSEHHEMIVRLDLEDLVVRADPRQLEQVLLNLTLNARDAMPTGGQVTIETNRTTVTDNATPDSGIPPGTYAVVTVTDTGHGMDRTTLQRVFEPFFTTKPTGSGTGLGLSVVHGIITQSGGYVRVRSKPGHGAMFRLYLPASRGEATAPDETAAESVPTAHGHLVLVVEDDATVRSMAARGLKEAGYATLEAAHGREALELIRRHAARLRAVVTDIGMPEMDGQELARHVRQEWPDIPVLLMSGYHDGERAEPVLQKPFAPDVLVRRVSEAIRSGNQVPPAGG